jgi:4-amino-4-deoxy-L-arabinose transferase-like glycosyltransferase
MNMMNHIKTKFRARQFLWCTNAILVYLALVKLVIHLVTSTGYGYFGDELYWIDITKHLDFGYVDVPPLVAYLGAFSRFLVGTSLFAVHLLPAIAGAVMVYFAGLMARELGGGRFAQCLTALMVIAAPIWLSFNSWFAYDPFDQLFTIIFLYLVILLLKQETPRRWVILGIITGVALMTKLSMLFTGFSLVLALLLTSRRKWLFSKWPLIAALIGLVIFTPFLVWQSIHAWPLLTYLRYYPSVHPFTGFLQSLGEQITFLNPVTIPIWILGLFYLLFHREGQKYRVLGLMYLILQLLLVGVLKLESRTSASAYFPLLAAGAVFAEKLIVSLTTPRQASSRYSPGSYFCAG